MIVREQAAARYEHMRDPRERARRLSLDAAITRQCLQDLAAIQKWNALATGPGVVRVTLRGSMQAGRTRKRGNS